jgi:uncharacterized membrane protein YgcG
VIFLRGVELPINTMIIVILCLVVLLAIVVLFFGVWNPGKGVLTQEAAKNNACQLMIASRCNVLPETITVRDFDADRDGTLNTVGAGKLACGTAQGDTLYMLCKCWYGINDALPDFDKNCKTICMCEGGSGGGGGGGGAGPGGGGISCPNGDSDCPPFTTCIGGECK